METETQSQVTEEELRQVFADTLDKGASFSGIFVSYREDGQERTEIGVPYSIRNGGIEVGPYFKNMVASPPSDYHKRKKLIPIYTILRYKRLELSDLTQ